MSNKKNTIFASVIVVVLLLFTILGFYLYNNRGGTFLVRACTEYSAFNLNSPPIISCINAEADFPTNYFKTDYSINLKLVNDDVDSPRPGVYILDCTQLNEDQSYECIERVSSQQWNVDRRKRI